MLFKKFIRFVGLKLIELSDMLVGVPVYRTDSEIGYACGATLVGDLLKENSSVFLKIYIWDRGKDFREPRYDEALQVAQSSGVPLIQSRYAVPWNYRRGRRFDMSAEFRKWDDHINDGNHLILDHPENIGSIGAISRTALAFGIHNIAVIDENNLDTFDPSLIRSSMGARLKEHIEVFSCIDEYLLRFSNNELYVLADDENAKRLGTFELQKAYSLVIRYKGSSLSEKYDGMLRRISIGNLSNIEALKPEIVAGIMLYSFADR